MIYVDERIQIPLTEIAFTFARSGGPGGQNVNKVNSKAILRWSVVGSPTLPWDVRARFMSRYANRMTVEGDLVLTSQTHRDQTGNVDECIEKLKEMLTIVSKPPVQRRATKPTYGSQVRRVEAKSAVGRKKAMRKAPELEE
jgi:ribosome-associated protein